ncbi:MAG: hypothetical protein M0Q23_00890 [Syntrophales bacterium]|jgi:hypothetical protein|nr:hypothetical protein [Syntrophales bacterium]MCK9527204.1 hypothetical protein [Syntrophales bacterium]MDX9921326.1 hypothetical protein [Syntrophales bacterium]
MWLACWTQEEIAEREQMTRQAVALILQEMAELPKLAKSDKSTASHETGFTPPLYNIWTKQTKTNAVSH